MAKMSYSAKAALPKGDFAVKGTGKYGGKGSYPIPDASHARNALARASGKPVEAEVRAKVHAKFPSIGNKPEHAHAATMRHAWGTKK
jgi:hypothetical protein